MGPRNHVLDGGPDPRVGRAIFFGERGTHRKVWGASALSCAKTATPIEMPFGMLTRMDPRNHALDGDPDRSWAGAILRGRACSDMPDDSLA